MHRKDDFIVLDDISKSYKDGDKERIVLDGLSGSIERGSINIIMGRSGCGKTTLLSVLAGIDKPTKGRLLYEGRDLYSVKKETRIEFRGKNIGIVFQDFNLLDEYTAEDNIKMPLLINHLTADRYYYDELISRLGLEGVTDRFPNEMSGGEKQRTAIARAMIIKPAILLADEPTGNLDEENSAEIARILCDINERYDTTIVMVTHDKDIIKNPDKMFYIKGGKLYQ